MKHFLLKFNHGVEIGATLAYVGHYFRTLDDKVWEIAMEEIDHKMRVENILHQLGEEPSKPIDAFFSLVGISIKSLCKICPVWSLNLVARAMEIFAVFNYTKLSKLYPEYEPVFLDMAAAEKRHGEYFARKNER